jgi:hypothetical protein
MNTRSFLNFLPAADTDERRARAWLVTVVLSAAIAITAVAIASSLARGETADIAHRTTAHHAQSN